MFCFILFLDNTGKKMDSKTAKTIWFYFIISYKEKITFFFELIYPYTLKIAKEFDSMPFSFNINFKAFNNGNHLDSIHKKISHCCSFY